MSNHFPQPVVPAARGGYHIPVMESEIVAALQAAPGRVFVDATLGGGGHTAALVRAGAKIIGLDQDVGAIGYCIQHLVVYDGDTVRLIKANFRHFDRVLDHLKVPKVDGFLLDLGVSSKQLDTADRGFSFQQAGPLDMRMDRSAPRSARDIVNSAQECELVRIFRELGEEPAARRIAAGIVAARETKPFEDTLSLAQAVERVVPRHGPKHPATRVFQALRMEVNDELGALSSTLEAIPHRLNTGGRLAVLTFHSLEDRIVKRFARETTAETIDRPEWPAPRKNPRFMFRSVRRKATLPSDLEIRSNPRARSAKLRVLERCSAVA